MRSSSQLVEPASSCKRGNSETGAALSSAMTLNDGRQLMSTDEDEDRDYPPD